MKKKNILIVFLIIIIVILLFATRTMKLKNNEEENYSKSNKQQKNNQNEIINTIINENIFKKIIGKYEYIPNIDSDIKEEDIKKCSPEVDVYFDIAKLEINNNDTYTFNYGTNCGSGYTINGKYPINNNKIYLFNDECKIMKTEKGECVYPNCDSLITLNYEEINGEINITYNHYSGNELKLEKIK